MSAFLVHPGHIDYLVSAAIAANIPYGGVRYGGDRVELGNADDAGRMLWRENLASVAYRYGDDRDSLPGPVPFPDVETYTFRQFRTLSPVQAFMATACYEYQSCEHPGWEASDALAFCSQLRRDIIAILPGYEDADWEIDQRGSTRLVIGPRFDPDATL